MINLIEKQLLNVDLLLNNIKHVNKNIKIDIIAEAFNPCLKWTYSNTAADDDAFLILLNQWLTFQKKHLSEFKPENKGKSSKTLLSELFGTTEFSKLELEELNGMNDKNLLQELEKELIWNEFSEIERQEESKSMKKVTVVMIKCKTGDILYFGKTTLFYFLISKEYIKSRKLPIYKEIQTLLFERFDLESIRKRPGMYIGSTGKVGICRLLSGLIEDLLKDAAEKVISLKLLPQKVFEITCESYLVKNNTCYYNHLTIVNELCDYFDYQDESGKISTKKGILTAYNDKNAVSAGIHIVFKLDESIFHDIDLDYFMILNRMTELAILNPYTIYLSDNENQNKICIPLGIQSLLKWNLYGLSRSNIITIPITDEQFQGEIAFSFSAPHAETRISYVNNQLTIEGGTHVAGMMIGANKAFKKLLLSYDNKLTPQDLLSCLNYVIHIQIDNPRYYGAVKNKLGNLEVKVPIQKQVEQELYNVLIKDILSIKSIYTFL